MDAKLSRFVGCCPANATRSPGNQRG